MKKSYFSALIVALLVFLFFLPNALRGKFPIPADALLNLYHPWRDLSIAGYNPGRFPAKNTLITDPILQTFPWRYLVIENLKSGNLPLWNPYGFAGQPLLANIQSAPFSILNPLFFIFPFNIAWVLQIILPQILLGIFTYLFLKNGPKLSKTASIFGGATMPFTGFFVSWSTWGSVVTTAMWLPLILLCQEMLFRKRSLIWVLILILAASQTILSGHWQTAFYVFIASIIYLIYKSWKSKNLRAIPIVIFCFVMGVLLSSVQVLPALEFITHSARETDQTYNLLRQDWFLPPQNLIQIIVPDFFGNPTTANYWGIWNYGEFASFVGIMILFLAGLASVKGKKDEKFFIFIVILSLFLALKNPISKLPYTLNFPLLSSIQPSRIIFLLVFSITILSAFGLDHFLQGKKAKIYFLPFIPVVSMLVLLAAFLLFTKNPESAISLRNMILPGLAVAGLLIILVLKKLNTPKSYIVLAIFLLSMLELFRFAYKFTPFSKLSWIFPDTRTLTFLKSQEKPFRVMTTDRRILHPNTSGVYGIESIDGYDPLYLASYAKYISVLQSQNPQVSATPFNRIITPQKHDSVLIDLLGAKYVLTFDEIKNPDFVKVFQEGETKTYLNKKALPRAFFASEVIKADSDNDELAKLLDKNFNIETTATSQNFTFPKQSINGQASFISYNDQSLAIKTSLTGEAPLILTNIYYPGWQAFIDGKKAKMNKVDFLFQSILIPQGEHMIEFQYQPQSFYNGLYQTLASLVITAVSLTFLWRKKYLS